MYGWVVPTMQPYAVTQAVGTIGAVIMPHNLYLHSGLVLSRKVRCVTLNLPNPNPNLVISRHPNPSPNPNPNLVISRKVRRNSPKEVKAAIIYNFLESAAALLSSFFINLAVVATNAANFYDPSTCNADPDQPAPLACLSPAAFNASGNHIDLTKNVGAPCNHNQGTGDVCGQLGLQAEGYALADALRTKGDAPPLDGSGMCGSAPCFIWALGLLAAGQAATMTCTYVRCPTTSNPNP